MVALFSFVLEVMREIVPVKGKWSKRDNDF